MYSLIKLDGKKAICMFLACEEAEKNLLLCTAAIQPGIYNFVALYLARYVVVWPVIGGKHLILLDVLRAIYVYCY